MTINRRSHLANAKILIGQSIIQTELFESPINRGANQEPKLFVIDVLDENGRPDQQELPIYGCQFNEEDVLHLLERYLIKLDIKRAKHVQLVADGAPWIWNRVPKLLRNVGVRENQLTQTLDFYHATQYIGLPQKVNATGVLFLSHAGCWRKRA